MVVAHIRATVLSLETGRQRRAQGERATVWIALADG